jgi:GMP synthase (glutamine-hydrolysing)
VETQSIVVLDFGAQYSQLIARRIREQKIFSVVLPFNASLEEIRSYSPVGIILSGGPSSVYDKDAPLADKSVFELGMPVLGICYGLQFMVYALGGKVRPPPSASTDTPRSRSSNPTRNFFKDCLSKLAVWMSHGDSAEELPAVSG